ncbi:T9SS type A sorting domain-containing protein, partial [bacterium]|nr:T9SS type A sorting domain-containing protein [bacterium]
PADFALYQNHPNPFNPATVIEFDLPGKAYTLLEVFDVNGSMIDILWEGGLEAGRYAFTFNGQGLSSGLYFCRLTADNFTAVSKLVLVK